MVLVDTSVWVDLLSKRPKYKPNESQLLNLVTCGPVLQEVLQGLRSHEFAGPFQNSFLAIPSIGLPVTRDLYLHAATIYRLGKTKGYTIRSSIDCLIAAIAMEYKVPVWHYGRDFSSISRYTSLDEFSHFP